jgi:uncharacterized protein (DUF433 family)
MSTTPITEIIPIATDKDGVIRVGNTRVTLDTIVTAFNEGATPEEIAQQYPVVSLADIYSVIGYYLHHPSEVSAYLSTRQRQSEEIRKQNESRFNPQGVRERLIARQAK